MKVIGQLLINDVCKRHLNMDVGGIIKGFAFETMKNAWIIFESHRRKRLSNHEYDRNVETWRNERNDSWEHVIQWGFPFEITDKPVLYPYYLTIGGTHCSKCGEYERVQSPNPVKYSDKIWCYCHALEDWSVDADADLEIEEDWDW